MDNWEINRLVARHVMGWTIRQKTDGRLRDGEALLDDGRVYIEDGEDRSIVLREWNPAEDIADAMRAAEKLVDEGCTVDVFLRAGRCACAIEDAEQNGYWGDAETLPLAICKAALAARGIHVDGGDDQEAAERERRDTRLGHMSTRCVCGHREDMHYNGFCWAYAEDAFEEDCGPEVFCACERFTISDTDMEAAGQLTLTDDNRDRRADTSTHATQEAGE